MIHDTRVMNDPDVESNHELVISKLVLKLQKRKQ